MNGCILEWFMVCESRGEGEMKKNCFSGSQKPSLINNLQKKKSNECISIIFCFCFFSVLFSFFYIFFLKEGTLPLDRFSTHKLSLGAYRTFSPKYILFFVLFLFFFSKISSWRFSTLDYALGASERFSPMPFYLFIYTFF